MDGHASAPRLIVVAERYDALRLMVQRVLVRARYRVAFPDADDTGLALCADARVDLLILDAEWAGDGPATIALATRLRADLPVLFIGEAGGIAGSRQDRRELRLQKPFDITALLRAVHLLVGDADRSAREAAPAAPPDTSSAAGTPALTADEVFATMRAYYEGLFPKTCPHCRRRFATLSEYVKTTTPVGRYLSYDLDGGDPTPEVGTLALASCPCGDTLALGTDGLPTATRLRLLDWVQGEASRRQISASDLMDQFRIELRRRIEAGDTGAAP